MVIFGILMFLVLATLLQVMGVLLRVPAAQLPLARALPQLKEP